MATTQEVVDQILNRLWYLKSATDELEEHSLLVNDEEISRQCNNEIARLKNQSIDLLETVDELLRQNGEAAAPSQRKYACDYRPLEEEVVPEMIMRIDYLDDMINDFCQKMKREKDRDIRELYKVGIVDVLNEQNDLRKVINNIVSGPLPFQLLHLVGERKAMEEDPTFNQELASPDNAKEPIVDSKKFEWESETSTRELLMELQREIKSSGKDLNDLDWIQDQLRCCANDDTMSVSQEELNSDEEMVEEEDSDLDEREELNYLEALEKYEGCEDDNGPKLLERNDEQKCDGLQAKNESCEDDGDGMKFEKIDVEEEMKCEKLLAKVNGSDSDEELESGWVMVENDED